MNVIIQKHTNTKLYVHLFYCHWRATHDSSTMFIVYCRYSYVDMDDDKKNYRPSAPKSVGYCFCA